jgi:hypothetical protein
MQLIGVDGTHFALVGTPTVVGTYVFNIEAVDKHGNFINKRYTINVIGIATTSLPNATNGTAYSATLQSAGTVTTPVTWSVASGTLPAGLSLNASTGVISGTPTATGTANITVQLASDGAACQKALSLTVAGIGPDWDSILLWGVAGTDDPGIGTGTFSPPNNTTSGTWTANMIMNNESFTGDIFNFATATYNGPAANCNLHVDVFANNAVQSSGPGPANGRVDAFIRINGGPRIGFFAANPAVGGYDFPFAIAAPANIQASGLASLFTASGNVSGQVFFTAKVTNV